ncbi:hypothetical protein UFOVP49_40 [uncultured Caudovirales phage]|uniref:Uncharacterized protein n=1 Tax=uncultured Caudovirales phage TaxID=2100421 RepID=A0A6J5KSE7_9CAUD|nr:hypothetical protein UFOVP49_40 [uncultured Caudovirales phage]
MEKVELRFLFDCENMKNILQYRHRYENGTTTPWENVPVVFDYYKDPYKDSSTK